MSDELLHDFEILVPPKRTASLLGEVIDLSVVPAVVTLKFVAFLKKHGVKTLESMNAENFEEGVLNDLVEIVALICQRSNKKITSEWLLSNLQIIDLMKFVSFVFEGITQLKKEEGDTDGKN